MTHRFRSLALASILSLAALGSADASERLLDGVLGGAAGGLVLGPVGLVGGAVIGATAGPGIAHSWGLKGHRKKRYRAYSRR